MRIWASCRSETRHVVGVIRSARRQNRLDIHRLTTKGPASPARRDPASEPSFPQFVPPPSLYSCYISR